VAAPLFRRGSATISPWLRHYFARKKVSISNKIKVYKKSLESTGTL
jgi:hypothetical protein